jgi:hypothetical protein
MTCQYSSQCSSYGSECDDQNYRDQCREMSKHFERPDRQVFSPASADLIFNQIIKHQSKPSQLEQPEETLFVGSRI